MVVTLVLTGLPHSVDVTDLAVHINNVLCTDEIGPFRMRSLPNHHRTNRRQIGLDFESGFDAMPAQSLIDGYEYVASDGTIHTIQAKIGTSKAVMTCDSVFFPDVNILTTNENNIGYSMFGVLSNPALIVRKKRIIERMKKEIVKEYEEMHCSDSEDSFDGENRRKVKSSSSLDKKSKRKRKKSKREKSPNHSKKKEWKKSKTAEKSQSKNSKSVLKKEKKIKKKSKKNDLKRHRHRSTSSEECYDRAKRRRLDESDHSLGDQKMKQSKLKGYLHKPKETRKNINKISDVSTDIEEHICEVVEKSRETDIADKTSKRGTHNEQSNLRSSGWSSDSDFESLKHVKKDNNLIEVTRHNDIKIKQSPKIRNDIVAETTEELSEFKKVKRKCEGLQDDNVTIDLTNIIVKSEPPDDMKDELSEAETVILSKNPCSVVTDSNGSKHEMYGEQNIHLRNHREGFNKTVKSKDDIWDVIDEVFQDIPADMF